jgi:hypothetical protein
MKFGKRKQQLYTSRCRFSSRISVGFWVLPAASMKVTVFWDVAPCSLVEIDRCFRGIALMMEAVSTSETSVNFYQTTWRNIAEDSHLHLGFRPLGLYSSFCFDILFIFIL